MARWKVVVELQLIDDVRDQEQEIYIDREIENYIAFIDSI